MIAYAGDKELYSLLVGDLCRLQPRVAPWGPAQDSHFWSVGNPSFNIVGLSLDFLSDIGLFGIILLWGAFRWLSDKEDPCF